MVRIVRKGEKMIVQFCVLVGTVIPLAGYLVWCRAVGLWPLADWQWIVAYFIAGFSFSVLDRILAGNKRYPLVGTLTAVILDVLLWPMGIVRKK